MPKRKTNQTAAKRYHVSGSGKVKRAQSGTSHNTAKKSRKRIRHLRSSVAVSDADVKTVKKMIYTEF